MAESFYRPLLQKAWEITWRLKFLWLFGAFAAIYDLSELDVFINNLRRVVTQSPSFSLTLLYQGELATNILQGVKSLFLASPYWSTIFVIILLFILFLIFLSQPALIWGAANAENQKSSRFSETLKKGYAFSGHAFVLNLIGKIFVWGLWFLIGLPLVTLMARENNIVWDITFVFFSILILVVLNFIVSFIIKYALAFVVLKGQKISQSLRSGWDLFVKNKLISLEMAIILFVVYFLLGLGLIIVWMLLAVPFAMIAMIFSQAALPSFSWFILTSGNILLSLILILGGGLIGALQLSAWTLLFLRLVEGKGLSKIYRMVSAPFQK